MKYFTKIFIIVFMIFLLLPINVFANSGENEIYCGFNADSEIKLNKGFNIYLNLQSDQSVRLSALRMDITFDSDNLKFMLAESDDDSDAEIKSALIDENTVRVIYINTAGKMLNSQFAQICSIRFKAITKPNNTTYTFSAKIIEAGDSNAEYISVGNSPTFSITSNNNNTNSEIITYTDPSNNSSSKSNNFKSDSSENKSSKSEKSNVSDNSDSDSSSSKDHDISIGDKKHLTFESGFSYFIYGVVGTLLLCAIVFAAYKIGKSKRD